MLGSVPPKQLMKCFSTQMKRNMKRLFLYVASLSALRLYATASKNRPTLSSTNFEGESEQNNFGFGNQPDIDYRRILFSDRGLLAGSRVCRHRGEQGC